MPTVFMHIPKTAGIALTDGLSKALASEHVVRGFDRVLFGAFRAFDTFSASVRAGVYINPADIPDGDFVSAHW